jgi:hypothetical protein
MSHIHDMAKAYQEQLLHDAESDQVRIDVAPQKRERALAFIRGLLKAGKPAPVASQRRREAADLDVKPV